VSPARRAVAGLLVALAAWLVIGVLRAEPVARDYFAHAHGEGATVENVEVMTVTPVIPPFWAVNISGEVIEAGRTAPGYISAMWLWIEPITGWVLVFGAG
jgi:hypothetical protein